MMCALSVCIYEHASLLRVTGHVYLISAGSVMAGERGPLQACGPGYQALPPSGMQILQGNLFQ